jgi:phosphoglycolate phosphatase
LTDIRGIIFDLDGTLLDSLEDIADLANGVLVRHGLQTYTSEEYRYFVGYGTKELFMRCAKDAPDALQSVMVQEYTALYEQLQGGKSKLYPKVKETLQTLFEKGLKIAVLSNKPHELTRQCVKRYLNGFAFDAVFGQREAVAKKPDPAAALEIAAIFGLSPSEIAFVGDTRVDMETANRSGMYALGAAWGFRDSEELKEYGANQIFNGIEELAGFLR